MTIWWRIGGAVAVAGLFWGHGNHTGQRWVHASYDAARQQTQADLMRTADELSMRAREIDRQEAALSARAQEAEDAARADFDVCRVPDPRSLRRLEGRWDGLAGP